MVKPDFITKSAWEKLTEEERESIWLRELVEEGDGDNTLPVYNECYELEMGDEEEYQLITGIDDDESDAESIRAPEIADEEEESSSDEEIINSQSENEENRSTTEGNCYIARDGTEWKSVPPPFRRTLEHNVFKIKNTGPTNKTKGLSIIETFKLLITPEMCDIIIRETNRRGLQTYNKYNESNPEKENRIWKPVTTTEFDAYLGILLFAGVSRSSNEHVFDLWKPSSNPLYRASMGVQRFLTISRFIRFDNANTRQERLKTDKVAPISDIWLMLNQNLKGCYIAGPHVTVDEQLYPYRGGTRFTIYMPSKPAKYGIKVWWVCDSTSSYPIKGQIYTGLGADGERERNQGERVVKDLCVNLFDSSGRTIVCDNFFTTYNLASVLMRDHKLALLGTINKRRRFIPAEFLINKNQPRETTSTMFGFSDDVTMCSYIPKKNKCVLLLSTEHYNTNVSEESHRKPEMIMSYNKLKGGVDNLDKMLGEYTCKRRTNRWPLAFFYNILDTAALACYIIHSANNVHLKKTTSSRRKFLQKLATELVMPEIIKRSTNTQVIKNFSPRSGLEGMLGYQLKPQIDVPNEPINIPERDATGRIKHKGNCYLCSQRRSTRKSCMTCQKPICSQHSVQIPYCIGCHAE